MVVKMKIMNGSLKGSFYVLEAAIAAIMMISTIAYVLQEPPEALELSKVNYKLKVYDALKICDTVGDLRKNTLDNNAAGIRGELSSYITFLDYDVAIYNTTSNITAVPTISSDNVLTVSYFLAGHVGNYTAREVRVFVWGFD